MTFDAFRAHRLKRAVTDVQCDLDDFQATVAKPRQQWRIEMQAGGRGSDRTGGARKDRLVALAVGFAVLAFDVGGKRHMADAIDRLLHRRTGVGPQADRSTTKEAALQNLAVKRHGTFKNDARA